MAKKKIYYLHNNNKNITIILILCNIRKGIFIIEKESGFFWDPLDFLGF